MAVSFVGTPGAIQEQSGSNSGAVTGAWSGTQPRTAGDYLVAAVTAWGTTTASAVSCTTPGWSLVVAGAGPGPRTQAALFAAVASGGDAAPSFTFTATGTAAQAGMRCEMFELTGQDAASPVGATGTAAGTSGTMSVASAGNVPAAGCAGIAVNALLLAGAGVSGYAAGAPWVNVDNDSAATYCTAGTTHCRGHCGFDSIVNPTSGAVTTDAATTSGTVTEWSSALLIVAPPTLNVTVPGAAAVMSLAAPAGYPGTESQVTVSVSAPVLGANGDSSSGGEYTWETFYGAFGPFQGYRGYDAQGTGAAMPTTFPGPAAGPLPAGSSYWVISFGPDITNVLNGDYDTEIVAYANDAQTHAVNNGGGGVVLSAWKEGDIDGPTPAQITALHAYMYQLIKPNAPDVLYGQIFSSYTANPASSNYPLTQWMGTANGLPVSNPDATPLDFYGLDGYKLGTGSTWANVFGYGVTAIRGVFPDVPLAIPEINCGADSNANPNPLWADRAAWFTECWNQAVALNFLFMMTFWLQQASDTANEWVPGDASQPATIAALKAIAAASGAGGAPNLELAALPGMPEVSGGAVAVPGQAAALALTAPPGTPGVSGTSPVGILIYDGLPELGDLAVSVAPSAGIDQYGNTYPLGIAVGSPLGPQVQLLPSAAIPVTTLMNATQQPASDIAAITDLEQIVALPTNSAGEAAPAIIGQTTITYTEGSSADALLILSGYPAGDYSNMGFSMYLSASSDGTKQASVIHGVYVYFGGTITLLPTMAEISSSTPYGSLAFYVPGAGPAMLQQTGTLIPPLETWTPFNPLLNSWAVAGGYANAVVRLLSSPRNCIQFDAYMSVGTATDGTIIGQVPARFRPQQSKTFPGWTDVQRVASGSNNEGCRFSLDTSGNIRCFGVAATATIAGLTTAAIPLDGN